MSRTPVQMGGSKRCGWRAKSRHCDPDSIAWAVRRNGVYGIHPNVEAPSAIRARCLTLDQPHCRGGKTIRAFGRGSGRFCARNRKILAYLRESAEDTLLRPPQICRVGEQTGDSICRIKAVVDGGNRGRTHFPPIGELPYL